MFNQKQSPSPYINDCIIIDPCHGKTQTKYCYHFPDEITRYIEYIKTYMSYIIE